MDVQSGRISAGSPGGDGGGDEHPGDCADVRPAPGHHTQDAILLGPAGLSPSVSAQAAQAGALHWRHRPDPRGRSRASQKTAPHGEAHLRAPSRRVRVRRRLHHGQGLRQRESPAIAGDVRTTVPCAGPRPVRLRGGPGGHQRSGAEGPLLRHRPAPQRRLLREGLPGRDHRGIHGRPRLGLRFPGRSAPEHSLRQHQAGGGEDTGGRPAQAHPRLHRAAVPLLV